MKVDKGRFCDTEFVIADGIEMPPRRPGNHGGIGGVGNAPKWPFRSMEVGQSFFVGGVSCMYMTSRFAAYRPMKFASRVWEENGVEGVRIWRVA